GAGGSGDGPGAAVLGAARAGRRSGRPACHWRMGGGLAGPRGRARALWWWCRLACPCCSGIWPGARCTRGRCLQRGGGVQRPHHCGCLCRRRLLQEPRPAGAAAAGGARVRDFTAPVWCSRPRAADKQPRVREHRDSGQPLERWLLQTCQHHGRAAFG
ncbi:unnamed protein product, partial [Prorocentrum cordatum]